MVFTTWAKLRDIQRRIGPRVWVVRAPVRLSRVLILLEWWIWSGAWVELVDCEFMLWVVSIFTLVVV